MHNPLIRFLIPCVLGAACATTTHDIRSSPGGLASELVAELDAGRVAEAERRFADVRDAEDTETLYPALFQTARQRHAAGDYAGASRVLGFMATGYPEAAAVREARLYSLFLLRSTLEAPDPELARELDGALADVRGSLREPVWIDLISTQQAVDRGDLAEARGTLARFVGSWDGEPAALALYVEDLQRYLATP